MFLKLSLKYSKSMNESQSFLPKIEIVKFDINTHVSKIDTNDDKNVDTNHLIKSIIDSSSYNWLTLKANFGSMLRSMILIEYFD